MVSKRKTVAFCIPNMIIGGVETVFCSTIDELSNSSDLKIQIITHAQIREPLYADWLKMHPELSVYVYYPLCNWFEDIAPRCRGILKPLRKIAFSLYKKYRRAVVFLSRRFINVDIFIDYKTMEFFKELRHFKQPKIGWIHANIDYIQENALDDRLHIYDKLICLTNDFANDFRKEYPELSEKIWRIYNPINKKSILKSEKKAFRPNSANYFVQVSRLDAKQKDIKTLLDAFELFYIKNNQPDVDLFIVGDGPRAHHLKQISKKLSSYKKIHFVGATTNPYGYMSGAMANILSTNYEGLPTVLLEAQVCGTINISANCKYGPSEILENGKSGLLFPVGNAEILSNLMQDVYLGKIDKQKIIKTAEAGLTRFTPSIIANQILEVLK